MDQRFISSSSWAFALAIMMLTSGCGEDDGLPRQAVSGAVTFDGKPLATGSIQFQPDGSADQGAVGAGAVIQDGRYAVDQAKGLTPGSYKVVILSHDSTIQIEEDAPGGGVRLPPELIPPQYNVNSTLTVAVSEGKENVFDFPLEKKAAFEKKVEPRKGR